jgi:NADPH2:quinone reductase
MAMKAVLARTFGAPETFELASVEAPVPGRGEIRVAVHAAGVSFVDLVKSSGKYQVKPPLPFIPGTEYAGVVEAVGPGMDFADPQVKVGDRVCGFTFGGAFAERLVVPASMARPVPEGMNDELAAVFYMAFTTSYYALVQRAALQSGETLVVLGAAGAVGHAAVQLGKARGARVLASASSPEKRELALAAGADAVVDSKSPHWRDSVRDFAGEHGVDVVVDPVGGEFTERALRSLGWNGRLLVIGFAAGGIPALPTNLALLKGGALLGINHLQFNKRHPEIVAANIMALVCLWKDGKISPAVGKVYPLSDFAAAMKDVADGATAGRVLMRIAS